MDMSICESNLHSIINDLNQIGDKWEEYLRVYFLQNPSFTLQTFLGFLGLFNNPQQLTVGLDYGNYNFKHEDGQDLYGLLFQLYYSDIIFESDSEFQQVMRNQRELIVKYLILTAKRPEEIQMNDITQIRQHLDSVFRIRLYNNHFFAFDYLEKLSLHLDKISNPTHTNLQEVYQLNDNYANIHTYQIQPANFLHIRDTNRHPYPIRSIADILLLIIQIRHAIAHNLLELNPYGTEIFFKTNRLQGKLTYAELFGITEICREFVKRMYHQIQIRIISLNALLNNDQEGKKEFFRANIIALCKRIDPNNTTLVNNVLTEFNRQIITVPIETLDIFQFLAKNCNQSGIAYSSQDIQRMVEKPEWW